MSKVWQIAVREFVATVFTKAFIIGLLIFPTIVGARWSLFGPRLFGDRNFTVAGADRRRRSDGRRAAASCATARDDRQVAGGRRASSSIARARAVPAGRVARRARRDDEADARRAAG